MNKAGKKEVAAAAAAIIFANEGGYTSINANDNGAVSVGKMQWHGNRALSLLKTIVQKMGQTTAANILGITLCNEILTAANWQTRTVDTAEKVKLSKLLETSQGRAAQDAQAETDILLYVSNGVKLGIEDRQSLIYYADLENQGGAGASKRVGLAAAQNAGGVSKVTLPIIHVAALADTVMGKYAGRRELVSEKAAALLCSTGSTEKQNRGKKMMTENELRSKVVQTAMQYAGSNEADGSHRKIIDGYNAHRPLARGYTVQYTDPWCATFVSFVALKCDITDIMPTECGCGAMIELYRKKGRWQENDAYRPNSADVIMYDWDDSGVGDCIGEPDHVGIVVSVSGDTIRVIEGNISSSVGYRNIKVNGKNIRGYCLPDYAGKAASMPSDPQISGSASSTATATGERTYIVKDGDSLWAIAAAYLGEGSKYNEIKILNGLTSDTIYTGQILKLP